MSMGGKFFNESIYHDHLTAEEERQADLEQAEARFGPPAGWCAIYGCGPLDPEVNPLTGWIELYAGETPDPRFDIFYQGQWYTACGGCNLRSSWSNGRPHYTPTRYPPGYSPQEKD